MAADEGIYGSNLPETPVAGQGDQVMRGTSGALKLIPCDRCGTSTQMKLGAALHFCGKDIAREKLFHLQGAKAGKEEELNQLKKSDPKRYLELFKLFCDGLPACHSFKFLGLFHLCVL